MSDSEDEFLDDLDLFDVEDASKLDLSSPSKRAQTL